MTSCYISVPSKHGAVDLANELQRRGIRAVFATDAAPIGASFSESVASLIKSCDVVLCIADDESSLSSALFEAGMAYGMGKRLLFVSSYESGRLPVSYSEFPIIRLPLTEYKEIANFVEDMIRFGKPPIARKIHNFEPSKPIGELASEYLARLDEIIYGHIGGSRQSQTRDLERLIGEAIRKSGVNVVSEVRSKSKPDFAIWSDELTRIGANPLIIEVKLALISHQSVLKETNQLLKYLSNSHSGLGLVIYGEGPSRNQYFYDIPTPILAISAKEFLEKLRNSGFGNVVRQLRNQRVHGIKE